MRKFVLGDIHGGFKALKQVFERSGFNNDEDQLIFLGDATDGWSQSFEVVEFLMGIKNLIFIRGNHDDWAIKFLKHAVIMRTPMFDSHFQPWLIHGGSATLESYIGKEEHLDKHIDFLKTSIPYYVDDENRIFVHAGFDIYRDIDDQPKPDHYYWWRGLWQEITKRYNNETLPGEDISDYSEIYIGHTPTIRTNAFKDGEPVNILNLWNVDTGAAFDGKITIMDIDTKEFYQSDYVYSFYPNEKGRNRDFPGKLPKVF